MPKLVCVKCQVGYRPDKNGVYLIEMAWKPPQPYKIWHSDMWCCPGCGHQVISGFADRPLSEHYQDNFDAILNNVVRAANDGKAVIVHEYERVTVARENA